jgi:ribosomal protein S18 acetylase RimI-like enzyme
MDPTRDSGSGMRIRPATRADAAALGRLGGLLLRAHHGFDPQRFMAPPLRGDEGYGRFLVSQLGEEDVAVLVAEQDGEVCGYVYAGLEPRSWRELREAAGFVHDVAVDEAARGAGVGTALVEAAVVWLRTHGAPRVLLWTAERNPAAQRLFAKLQFRRTMIEMTREL